MTQFYLMNNLVMGTSVLFAGSLIDDTNTPTAPILAVGGKLQLAAIPGLATAAALAQSAKLRGQPPEVFESIMNAALDQAQTDYATAHDTVDAASIVTYGKIMYSKPIAAELISIVNDVQLAAGALALASQPNVPCKLQVRITDANSTITAGTITLVGVGAAGQVLNQVITLVGGTRTVITDDAFAVVTSATVSAMVGNEAADHISIGVGSALGLPIPSGATSVSVYKATVDYVNETVGVVDATARTIAPNTAGNGTREFEFWYRYTTTHLHTMS